MEYLQVKSWAAFQHYKDDRPLRWIKVYQSILMDYKYEQLSDAEFGALVKLWLLASQLNNKIPNDSAWIQKKASLSQKPNIDKYLQLDFLQVCDSVPDRTSSYDSVPRVEKSRVEKSREEKKNTCALTCAGVSEKFERFWSAYPKKKSKDAALKAFKKRNPDDTLFEEIMTGLEKAKQSSDWLKEGGRFIPHPATWLNAGGWMDEEAEIEGAPYSETTAQNLRVLKDWRPT